jgi:hypothetical protein
VNNYKEILTIYAKKNNVWMYRMCHYVINFMLITVLYNNAVKNTEFTPLINERLFGIDMKKQPRPNLI